VECRHADPKAVIGIVLTLYSWCSAGLTNRGHVLSKFKNAHKWRFELRRQRH